MSKFKVGDRVRRLSGFGTNAGRKEGEVFTVEVVTTDGWVKENGARASHNPDFLELVVEPATSRPFQVGDIVRRTKHRSWGGNYAEGSVFEVKSLDADGDVRDAADAVHQTCNIELVTPAVPPSPVEPASIAKIELVTPEVKPVMQNGEHYVAACGATLTWRVDGGSVRLGFQGAWFDADGLDELSKVAAELAAAFRKTQ